MTLLKRYFVIAALVLMLALLAVFGWRDHRSSDNGQSRVAVGSQGGAATSDSTAAETVKHVLSGGRGRTNSVAPESVARILKTANDKDEALQRLLAPAEAGNVEYLLAISELMARCGGGRVRLERDLADLAPAEAKLDHEWQLQAKRFLDYCGEAGELDRRAEVLLEKLPSRLAALAKEGDRFSALYLMASSPKGGRMTEAQSAFAEDVMHDLKRTTLASRAANFYLQSSSSPVVAIDRRLAAQKMPASSVLKAKQAASALYQCHWGNACGPDSQIMRDNCLAFGFCARGLSLAAYYRRSALSAGEQEAMDSYLRLLLAGDAVVRKGGP